MSHGNRPQPHWPIVQQRLPLKQSWSVLDPVPRVVVGALVAAFISLALGCGPVLIEREGHLVFNPHYLRFLDGKGRDGWQRPEAMLDALALSPDMVVADVGAGSGYFTERISQRLSDGRVYATDVQGPMIEALHRRVQERGLENVLVVKGTFDDPMLPLACCDLVFFSSVYKEIDRERNGRVAYMRKVRATLQPHGRVAILEFRPGAKGPGPPPEVRLAAETIIRELEEAGFALTTTYDVVPRQSFLVFTPTGQLQN